MYYINTAFGVLLVDIKNDNINSIIYENNQLVFTDSTILQLIITHDPENPSLAILLASFLNSDYQCYHDQLFTHGEGSLPENNFLLFANNDDYEMLTETYSQNDFVDLSQVKLLASPTSSGLDYPCLFNCPSEFTSSTARSNHYQQKHFFSYQNIKKKYSQQTECPLCHCFLVNFLSFIMHLQLYHRGKKFAEF